MAIIRKRGSKYLLFMKNTYNIIVSMKNNYKRSFAMKNN